MVFKNISFKYFFFYKYLTKSYGPHRKPVSVVDIRSLRSSSEGLTDPQTASSLLPTTAAAAVSTDGPDETVDDLDGTEHNLQQTHDQQHGEQSQVPGHDAFRLSTALPQCVVIQVVTVDKRIGPQLCCAIRKETFGSVVNGNSRHNEGVAGPQNPHPSKDDRGEHCKSLSTTLIATATAAVIVFKAQEDQRWEDHHNTRSHDTPKVKHFIGDVVIVFCDQPPREEEQDVAENTQDGQGDQGDTQTLGKTTRTHGRSVDGSQSLQLLKQSHSTGTRGIL